jgi:hypothetical protein
MASLRAGLCRATQNFLRAPSYSQKLWKKLWKVRDGTAQLPVIIDETADCTRTGQLVKQL